MMYANILEYNDTPEVRLAHPFRIAATVARQILAASETPHLTGTHQTHLSVAVAHLGPAARRRFEIDQ